MTDLANFFFSMKNLLSVNDVKRIDVGWEEPSFEGFLVFLTGEQCRLLFDRLVAGTHAGRLPETGGFSLLTPLKRLNEALQFNSFKLNFIKNYLINS